MSGRLAPVRSACNFGASLKCPNILNLYAERCRHESRASAEEGRKGCLAYSSIVQVRRCHRAHSAIDGRKFLQRHKDWLAHNLTDVPSSLGHANSGRRSPLLAYPCQLVRQASAWPLGNCHITCISVSSVCSAHSIQRSWTPDVCGVSVGPCRAHMQVQTELAAEREGKTNTMRRRRCLTGSHWIFR